ncbi:hypothetical protein [Spirulina sp. 06S082]|uniref:hypothetical protein n=1 Tax=Spirulina sp. 06S082 TaxID=3110248 RepID=UPI002B21FABA|nr:hypothetical protein [Spirulina sp. 06S082]MEA5472334.1 hypothetical protein [Spirulina sp. 06S082]
MNTFVYDGSSKDLQKAIDLSTKGEKVLCHKCGAELLIIASVEEEAKYGKSSGIYCPTDPSHIQIHFTLGSRRIRFWKEFAPHLLEKLEPQSPSTDNEKNQ